MSAVTVPERGFGISPRGPSTLPSRPTMPIMSGVATATSKSVQPPWMRCRPGRRRRRSRRPASSASRALSPWANASTRTRLAGARGQDGRAAHHLIGVARVEAGANVQLDGLDRTWRCDVSLTSLTPRVRARRACSGSTFSAAARYSFRARPCRSTPDRHAHAARGAFDHPHRGLDVVGVQVFHLDLGDLARPWSRVTRADLVAARRRRCPCRCPRPS